MMAHNEKVTYHPLIFTSNYNGFLLHNCINKAKGPLKGEGLSKGQTFTTQSSNGESFSALVHHSILFLFVGP